jgi:hypothetical protein
MQAFSIFLPIQPGLATNVDAKSCGGDSVSQASQFWPANLAQDRFGKSRGSFAVSWQT